MIRYAISPFVFLIIFFSTYIVLFLAGYLIIDWNSLSLSSVLAISVFICGVLYGALFGMSSKLYFLNIKKISIGYRFLYVAYLVLSSSVLFSISLMISEYGSVGYIMTHAFVIRESVIGGDGFIPFYISYINSLNQAFYAISIILYYKEGVKKFAIMFFVNIVLCDLLTFGRVGTLNAIFMFAGFIFMARGVKIITYKTISVAVIGFFVLNLSRIIRGGEGGFSASLLYLWRYLKIDPPEWSYGIISNYLYYFSSPIAFSEYLQNSENYSTPFGQRLFTPIYNIILRIAGLPRINTIDEFVQIPYSTNIYTVLRDIHSDLGVMGIVFCPILFGYIFSVMYRSKEVFGQSVFLMLIGCAMFFPLYNSLSFGMFFLSITLLFVLHLFFRFNLK